MRQLKKQYGWSFLVAFVATTAVVSARDITIFDRQTGAPGWYSGDSDLELHPVPPSYPSPALQSVREDDETEPGTIATQAWDFEAIDLRGTTLTIVGGYQWNKGTAGLSSTTSLMNDPGYYYPGDIFIDVDGFPNPASPGGPFAAVANPGFDYAITFDSFERGAGAGNAQGHIGAGAYTIRKLTGAVTVVTSQFIPASNPFRWLSGGSVIGTGTATHSGPHDDAAADTFINSDNPGSYTPRSLLGGTHYYLALDVIDILDDMAKGETFGGHITMGCGNDEIVGWMPPSGKVPDSGLGLGLLGISFLATHFAKRKFAR